MQQGIEVNIAETSAPPTLSESKTHIFLSADKYWRIALNANSISLSTKQYQHWDELKERAERCLKNFFGIYPIKVVTRIGLRYRDVIRRSKIDKAESEWRALINPSVLGPMGSDEFRSIPLESARWLQQFAVGDVKITFQGGVLSQEGEQSYFFDCAVSLSKEVIAGADALQSELEQIHKPIGPLFRWAITDELHTALGPKSP
jgi:uncharacterized protein (TIGR04255 family)